ncbi:MAG: cytochrome P460 family protein [Candidatus Tectimicrobiota bacterium]
MTVQPFTRRLCATVAVASLVLGTAALLVGATEGGKAQFDQEGALLRPTGYREWVFVGAPVTPHDMNEGKAPFPEFHNVYIDPASYREYTRTGTFPDGTMLIKELVSVGSKQGASGKGYFQGEFIGLEASVKDSKRFAQAPGNWAFFSFSNPDHTLPVKAKAMAQPLAACTGCHQGAAATDLVFTQYYPVLRAARP